MPLLTENNHTDINTHTHTYVMTNKNPQEAITPSSSSSSSISISTNNMSSTTDTTHTHASTLSQATTLTQASIEDTSQSHTIRLENELDSGWKTFIVDYSTIRHNIKKIVHIENSMKSCVSTATSSTATTYTTNDLQKAHHIYWYHIQESIELVNRTYCQQEYELYTIYQSIQQQYDRYWQSSGSSHHTHQDHTHQRNIFIQSLKSIDSSLAHNISLQHTSSHHDKTSTTTTITTTTIEEDNREWSAICHRILELCHRIDQLRKYIVLNICLLMKSIRLYDSSTNVSTKRSTTFSDFMKFLGKQQFVVSKKDLKAGDTSTHPYLTFNELMLATQQWITKILHVSTTTSNTEQMQMQMPTCQICHHTLCQSIELLCTHIICIKCWLHHTTQYTSTCAVCEDDKRSEDTTQNAVNLNVNEVLQHASVDELLTRIAQMNITKNQSSHSITVKPEDTHTHTIDHPPHANSHEPNHPSTALKNTESNGGANENHHDLLKQMNSPSSNGITSTQYPDDRAASHMNTMDSPLHVIHDITHQLSPTQAVEQVHNEYDTPTIPLPTHIELRTATANSQNSHSSSNGVEVAEGGGGLQHDSLPHADPHQIHRTSSAGGSSSDDEGEGDDHVEEGDMCGSSNMTPRKSHKVHRGYSCHQCKTTKVVDSLLFCVNKAVHGAVKKKCRKKYCDSCLRRWYNTSVYTTNDLTSASWFCPSCLLVCCCATCLRKQKQFDETGQTPHIAQKAKLQHEKAIANARIIYTQYANNNGLQVSATSQRLPSMIAALVNNHTSTPTSARRRQQHQSASAVYGNESDKTLLVSPKSGGIGGGGRRRVEESNSGMEDDHVSASKQLNFSVGQHSLLESFVPHHGSSTSTQAQQPTMHRHHSYNSTHTVAPASAHTLVGQRPHHTNDPHHTIRSVMIPPLQLSSMPSRPVSPYSASRPMSPLHSPRSARRYTHNTMNNSGGGGNVYPYPVNNNYKDDTTPLSPTSASSRAQQRLKSRSINNLSKVLWGTPSKTGTLTRQNSYNRSSNHNNYVAPHTPSTSAASTHNHNSLRNPLLNTNPAPAQTRIQQSYPTNSYATPQHTQRSTSHVHHGPTVDTSVFRSLVGTFEEEKYHDITSPTEHLANAFHNTNIHSPPPSSSSHRQHTHPHMMNGQPPIQQHASPTHAQQHPTRASTGYDMSRQYSAPTHHGNQQIYENTQPHLSEHYQAHGSTSLSSPASSSPTIHQRVHSHSHTAHPLQSHYRESIQHHVQPHSHPLPPPPPQHHPSHAHVQSHAHTHTHGHTHHHVTSDPVNSMMNEDYHNGNGNAHNNNSVLNDDNSTALLPLPASPLPSTALTISPAAKDHYGHHAHQPTEYNNTGSNQQNTSISYVYPSSVDDQFNSMNHEMTHAPATTQHSNMYQSSYPDGYGNVNDHASNNIETNRNDVTPLPSDNEFFQESHQSKSPKFMPMMNHGNHDDSFRNSISMLPPLGQRLSSGNIPDQHNHSHVNEHDLSSTNHQYENMFDDISFTTTAAHNKSAATNNHSHQQYYRNNIDDFFD